MGSAPSELSMVRVTSARPSGWRWPAPAKMTSSILPPRSDFAPCSPITQLSASSTFDLPDPFGPTTQVIPGSKRSVVAEAKDLKPFSVRLLRCTKRLTSPVRLGRLGAILSIKDSGGYLSEGTRAPWPTGGGGAPRVGGYPP